MSFYDNKYSWLECTTWHAPTIANAVISASVAVKLDLTVVFLTSIIDLAF